MRPRRIFVTGGASGLGRALAERYARAGFRVCIGDVHEARGAETCSALRAHGREVEFLRCDVTSEADLEAAAAWLDRSWGGVDVVVNNAGVAAGGGIAETPIEDWKWILDVNLLGVVRGCKVFTPRLRRQGGGRFVNVASMAGLVHPPMMAAYNATKAAVVALSETLRLELAKDRIAISVVCPGFFRTHLTEHLRATDPEIARITHHLVDDSHRSAESVAEDVFRGVARGDFHVLTHLDGRAAWMLKRLAPGSLYHSVMALATERMMGRRAARREER